MSEAMTKTGSPGRPAGRDSDKVRADLLKAAEEHFLSRDFKAVSLRQIAETAGVNGAMVNYYFGGKQGLYMAMVDDLFKSLDQSLEQLGEGSKFTVAQFSQSYSRILCDNPWWPNFMVREVLFGEGETRNAIVDKFSSSVAPMLLQSIEQEISDGNYRQDLDPKLALLSLMSMTIFPFLAKPLVEQILGLSLDQDAVEKMSTHTTQLFFAGVEDASSDERANNKGDQT
ncbi:MAG: hypothetical protein COA96_10955 [SAR86 cluster bacterium]|uniref:HTH tetR-type domain-containing protein n=1 Tax=SAR86 cluster bacterium TaxID=2030880 RepID=A0A2A5AYG6_9GAMM|nr:MAG: hypothetical protein COA96_10955 [SAR86 cluster bacterium]